MWVGVSHVGSFFKAVQVEDGWSGFLPPIVSFQAFMCVSRY